MQHLLAQLTFIFNLYYNRIFYPYNINHYNIVNKLSRYKCIHSNYINKYPAAIDYSKLDKLFEDNPTSKREFHSCVDEQESLKNQVVHDIKLICRRNKVSNLNSEWFQTFFIKSDYHIEQNIDGVIDYVKKDVLENKF
jgi:hypothetical protein